MAANAAAAYSSISQEEYEKQLSGKSAGSLFANETVRSDFARNFSNMNESEGKDLRGDVVATDLSVADVLPKFRGTIKERFEADKEKGLPDARKWLFQSIPMSLCPGKTLDDFFTGMSWVWLVWDGARD